jgi:hypothetical protein
MAEIKTKQSMTDKEKEKLTRISRLLDNNQVSDPELRAKLQAERDMLEEKASHPSKKEEKKEPKTKHKKANKIKRTKPKTEKKAEVPKAKRKIKRTKPKPEPKKALKKVRRTKPKKEVGKARTLKRVGYLNEKGNTKKSIDKKIAALHPGKRESKFGKTYYEYRANRADLNRKKKLEKGGEI